MKKLACVQALDAATEKVSAGIDRRSKLETELQDAQDKLRAVQAREVELKGELDAADTRLQHLQVAAHDAEQQRVVRSCA